jgi:predicted AAA+ superfamily ATPase
LLSSELSTHLTGRFNQVELFPFSFREKRDYLGRGTQLSTRDRAVLMQDYVDYSIRGGLPETFTMKDPRPYIKTLYDSILFRDIVQRHSVRYAKLFSDVAALTLQNHCREVNFSSLAKQLNVRSVHTVQNYIKYLEQAYLTIPLHKFAFKPVKRLRETKVYAVDMSFVHYFKGVDASGENLGWKLENLVFLKLQSMRLKCDFELSYYKNGREVDFVLIRHGKVCQLIQVAYDISDPKTRAREIKSLLAVSDVLKCRNLLLITASENGIVKDGDKTISIASAPEWLLEPGINAPAPPSA